MGGVPTKELLQELRLQALLEGKVIKIHIDSNTIKSHNGSWFSTIMQRNSQGLRPIIFPWSLCNPIHNFSSLLSAQGG